MIGKTTLCTGGRHVDSHQNELLNVSLRLENLQSFLYTGSTQMVSLQYELLNVSANSTIRKTNLYTGRRHVVSHQYELLNVSAMLEKFFVHREHANVVSPV
jgi:hypothetical protein